MKRGVPSSLMASQGSHAANPVRDCGESAALCYRIEMTTVSAADAMRLFLLSKSKILRSIYDGPLPAKSLYGRLRILFSDLDAFVGTLHNAIQAVQP